VTAFDHLTSKVVSCKSQYAALTAFIFAAKARDAAVILLFTMASINSLQSLGPFIVFVAGSMTFSHAYRALFNVARTPFE
jgi:hypothetical protein